MEVELETTTIVEDGRLLLFKKLLAYFTRLLYICTGTCRVCCLSNSWTNVMLLMWKRTRKISNKAIVSKIISSAVSFLQFGQSRLYNIIIKLFGINGGRIGNNDHCRRWVTYIEQVKPMHIIVHIGASTKLEFSLFSVTTVYVETE
jgi:hypothetical protein